MHDIAFYLPNLALAVGIFLLGMMSPGPNILSIMGTSMSLGRKPGRALAFGIATGSVAWALVTVAGLSILLATYAEALIVIKILGGCYLLWLALKAFRAAGRSQAIEAHDFAGQTQNLLGCYLRGLAIQMTNPKAALSWLAIVSLGLQGHAPLWVDATLVLGTGVLSLLLHWLYAVVFSTKAMVRLYGRARRSIQTALGCFFCFAGVKLLTSRL
jgi:threonine efflux protein